MSHTAEEVVEGLNSIGRQVGVVVLNCMNSMAEVVVHVDWAMRPKSANLMGGARAEPTTYGPLAFGHWSREQITGIVDYTVWFSLSRTMSGPLSLCTASTRQAAVLQRSHSWPPPGQSARTDDSSH